MEPVHYNFSRICRACKEESNELQPMFENNEIVRPVMKKSFRLAEMLMACASVHVSDDDGLPHSMCVPCVTKLNNAYVFKQQCEITDSFLRLYLQQNAIKEENQLEVDYEVLNVPEIDSSPVTKNVSDVENKSQENDKDSDKFSCNVCSKQFQSSSALKFHQKQHDYIHSNLTCKICFKKFNYFSHLQRHMRIHNPQKIYICKICDKRLSRLEHLKRHMITHLKTKPFSCRICKRGFNHSENLYNHERRCKGDRIFVCEVCNRGFSRPDALEAHMSNHDSQVDVKPMLESLENIDKYIHIENFNEIQEFGELSTCFEPQIHILEGVDVKKEISELANSSEISVKEEDIEEETLKKQMKSIAHGESTQGDPNWSETKTVNIPIKRKRGRPRKGEIRPSESTKEVKNLINNFHFNTTSKTFNCRICQKEFQRLSHLQRHMLCHGDSKPFGCELCPKTFTRKDHMVRHMKLHTIQKEFKCDLCWREFFREDQLIQHKAIKHDIGEKVISEKKYKCHICHKAFTTEKYRDTHVEAHGSEKHKVYTCKACEEEFKCKTDFIEHEKQNPQCSKRFLCSECGQRFIRKNYLVVHMRRHRGEKPFKCKYCGKGFPRSTDVTRHERYHTGEKNHLCIICGKGFGRAYNLTLHMRTHTGEKPYQCNFCDAAFAQSNDLKSHTRRHTGERYHCDLCNEAFLMGYLLKQHKRNVHGLDLPSQRIQPLKMLPETTTNVDDIKMQ